MFGSSRKRKQVAHRLDALEKRRRSVGIMAVLLLLSLGFGLYVMFMPGKIEPVKPLFGTLPVLRGGLLVLLTLLSAYILRGEVEHSKLLRELWEKKVNIDTLNQRVMELSVLHDVSAAINSMSDMGKMANVIMDSAFKLMAAEMGVVMVRSDSGDKFDLLISRNLSDDVPDEIEAGGGTDILSRACVDGRIIVLGDAANDDMMARFAGTDRKMASAICAPLKHKGKVDGLFFLGNLTCNHSFDQRDVELLAIFADQVAIALENARLFQDLQQSLAELKETQANMIQSSKMAAVGQLAAGVAHELNNPIVGILGYAQYSLEKIRDKVPSEITGEDVGNFKKYVGYIEHESQRCKVIIQNLLNFSRKNSVDMEMMDVNAALKDTFTFTAHQLELGNIELTYELSDPLKEVYANGPQLQQVFTNITINALCAMKGGGKLHVVSGLRGEPDSDDAVVEISFTDTGCGMSPEVQARIFDPFFTTRKIGEGTGLGLSLSHGIIENHGGDISVESEAGRGTTFTISLPTKKNSTQPVEVEAPYSMAVE